jgi:hypothetical protein
MALCALRLDLLRRLHRVWRQSSRYARATTSTGRSRLTRQRGEILSAATMAGTQTTGVLRLAPAARTELDRLVADGEAESSVSSGQPTPVPAPQWLAPGLVARRRPLAAVPRHSFVIRHSVRFLLPCTRAWRRSCRDQSGSLAAHHHPSRTPARSARRSSSYEYEGQAEIKHVHPTRLLYAPVRSEKIESTQ